MGNGLWRIGLTGGIAAGKSTVANHLRKRGVAVLDYDCFTHMLEQAQSPAIMPLVGRFGKGMLAADGSVDRKALSRIVFASQDGEQALADLNAIMHPLVYALASQAERQATAQSGTVPIVVHDVPLLAQVIDTIPFEFTHIITVEAPQSVRIRRMVQTRGMEESEARARIAAQAPDQARLAIADIVVDSTVPIEQMFEELDMLVDAWNNEIHTTMGDA